VIGPTRSQRRIVRQQLGNSGQIDQRLPVRVPRSNLTAKSGPLCIEHGGDPSPQHILSPPLFSVETLLPVHVLTRRREGR
jgi:hypothetical protein